MTESGRQSKPRMSHLADGTTVDQEYYQSKHYILSQLEARKGGTPDATKGDKPAEGPAVDKTTQAMLKSGAISEDDGWLLASMELAIRNPFCIANHSAQEQVKFYQKVFLISAIFMFAVAFATCMWTWWWGVIIKGGATPLMPCRGSGNQTFGVVRLCNATGSEFNTELGDDGCDEGAPLSICVQDSCINANQLLDDCQTPECVKAYEDGMKSCWFMGAFVMVVLASYMMLLFRRDAAGKGLLSCTCFIEGILGGAATLHYDSSMFMEFFTYLTCASVLALAIFTKLWQKNQDTWSNLESQVGSTKLKVPEVEVVVFGAVKKSLLIGGAVVSVVSLLWHLSGISLTGGTTLAFFLAIFVLWVSIAWIVREISWTMKKYDADQFVNMVISFHVDLYCIFILFGMFIFFLMSDSCHQGISCPVHCATACALQCERCARFACAVPGRGYMHGADGDQALKSGDPEKKSSRKSVNVEKDVETQDQWRRRKMINAGCAVGILLLAAISFVAPMVSFAISLAICLGLPFLRAHQNKEEDHSNV